MIAIIGQRRRGICKGRWQHLFLEMLPSIRRQAMFYFRGLRAEAREELVEEVLANCCMACCRLSRRGKLSAARPSPLVRYAVSQVRAGRRVGCRLNCHDITSEYARQQNGLKLERLDQRDANGQWRAALVEDHHTPVAQQVAFRIDFPIWLGRLTVRQRRIAKFLAAGNATKEAAIRFHLSPSRVSQLRRELNQSWLQFHREELSRHTSRVAS